MDHTALLLENALTDAREVAVELGRDFTDEDVRTGELGDLMLAAVAYIKITDRTDNSFINSVKTQYASKGMLSIPQARAVLNNLRKDVVKNGDPVIDPREVKTYRCYRCNETVTGITALRAHKQGHYAKPVVTEGEAVIENREQSLGLDISSLPNGYYAVPDLTGKTAFIYLMVRRTRKRVFRDRRYRFGKIIVGGEWVPEGTIEVKEWSSDSKRLCGEQKPDDCYRGEFEAQMPMLLGDPRLWAVVFGQQIGRCGRCGKTLTDDESRQVGIGPECQKHGNYWASFGKKVASAA